MPPGLIPRGAVTAIASAVIVVWGVTQIADAFVEGYDAPAEIHLAVMLVLGALFGLRKDDDPKADPKADAKDPEPSAEPPPAPDPPIGPGQVSAAELIARLQQERRDRG